MKSADPRVDRVDGSAADRLEDRVAGLLQMQPALEDLAPVLSHRDRILVAEEVRRVQQVDVQRVAGDPFAAVQQPPQGRDLLVYDDAANLLHRLPSAGLIGDRADATDAGGEVGDLGVLPAAEKCLEEARRLVDPQLGALDSAVLDDDTQGALALDPGQCAHLQVPTSGCHLRSPFVRSPAPRR